MLNHRIYTNPLQPLIQHQQKVTTKKSGNELTFGKILQEELQEGRSLKISKHAAQRMSEREIAINDNTWQRIESKLSEARQKGVNDSLILLEGAALVVNAKSNTVITAMNRYEASSHIFTNINGTIIID